MSWSLELLATAVAFVTPIVFLYRDHKHYDRRTKAFKVYSYVLYILLASALVLSIFLAMKDHREKSEQEAQQKRENELLSYLAARIGNTDELQSLVEVRAKDLQVRSKGDGADFDSFTSRSRELAEALVRAQADSAKLLGLRDSQFRLNWEPFILTYVSWFDEGVNALADQGIALSTSKREIEHFSLPDPSPGYDVTVRSAASPNGRVRLELRYSAAPFITNPGSQNPAILGVSTQPFFGKSPMLSFTMESAYFFESGQVHKKQVVRPKEFASSSSSFVPIARQELIEIFVQFAAQIEADGLREQAFLRQ